MKKFTKDETFHQIYQDPQNKARFQLCLTEPNSGCIGSAWTSVDIGNTENKEAYKTVHAEALEALNEDLEELAYFLVKRLTLKEILSSMHERIINQYSEGEEKREVLRKSLDLYYALDNLYTPSDQKKETQNGKRQGKNKSNF